MHISKVSCEYWVLFLLPQIQTVLGESKIWQSWVTTDSQENIWDFSTCKASPELFSH